MLSPDVPRPIFASLPTITNAMELIVSPAGEVDHVRLVTDPRRMTDMMILSAAKLWKFAPAVKDGHPVRYRLIITWQVNP
jgi:outer membrane biosynthesis protein TonB